MSKGGDGGEWRLGFGWPDDAVRDGGDLAAGFVRVEAVVAHYLLSFRREVFDSVGKKPTGGRLPA
jgi:hypothetical protein